MAVITLLTDFGRSNAFVGTMKGVILTIAPHAQIVDLTHAVPPQSILSGAFLLKTSYTYFPEGTIHVAVVDPGVGTERRAIAVRSGGYTFVVPDNGLLTYVLRRETSAAYYELNRPEFFLPHVSRTFHGRDVFAPVAGHLARGVSVEEMGTRIDTIVTLNLSTPVETEAGWMAHVIHIDHFGNLITDFELSAAMIRRIRFRDQAIPFAYTYQDVPPGQPVALFGSSGHLEVAVNQGNAASALQATVGEAVNIDGAV